MQTDWVHGPPSSDAVAQDQIAFERMMASTISTWGMRSHVTVCLLNIGPRTPDRVQHRPSPVTTLHIGNDTMYVVLILYHA